MHRNPRRWGSPLAFLTFGLLAGMLALLAQATILLALTPAAAGLLQGALNFLKNGRPDDAARSYEQALRLDPTVARANDQGLIQMLRDRYRKRIAEHPDDWQAFEAMGFVSATCDGDEAGAMEMYVKALALTNDEAEKRRLSGLIDACKVRLGVPVTVASSPQGPGDGSGANGEAPPVATGPTAATTKARQEQELAELGKARNDAESRVSGADMEIENLKEEIKKNRRLFNSSNDRRYKRKEDAGEKALAVKERRVAKLRERIQEIDSAIDRVKRGELGTGHLDEPPEDSEEEPVADDPGDPGDDTDPADEAGSTESESGE